jgi:hypothetical protein
MRIPFTGLQLPSVLVWKKTAGNKSVGAATLRALFQLELQLSLSA